MGNCPAGSSAKRLRATTHVDFSALDYLLTSPSLDEPQRSRHGCEILPLRRCFQPPECAYLEVAVSRRGSCSTHVYDAVTICHSTKHSFSSSSSHYIQISSSQKHSRFIQTSLQPLQSLASPKHPTNLPAPWTTQHSCIRRSLVSVVVPRSTDNKVFVTCGGEENQFFSGYLSIHSSSW